MRHPPDNRYIFHYSIIKKLSFSKLTYLTTNWITFWTSEVYFFTFWVAMGMSYISGIVIFMVKWYSTQPPLRVCGSNPHIDLIKGRLKLLLLTSNTLICSNFVQIASNSTGFVFNWNNFKIHEWIAAHHETSWHPLQTRVW